MDNNTMVSPLVWIRGRPYLVVNFDLDDPPCSNHWLLLRPLSPEESQAVAQFNYERDCELWAFIVVAEENRFCPRE